MAWHARSAEERSPARMADPPPRRRTRRTWRPRPSALVATGRQAGVHVPLRGGPQLRDPSRFPAAARSLARSPRQRPAARRCAAARFTASPRSARSWPAAGASAGLQWGAGAQGATGPAHALRSLRLLVGPAFFGRRVEVGVGDRALLATVLDTGVHAVTFASMCATGSGGVAPAGPAVAGPHRDCGVLDRPFTSGPRSPPASQCEARGAPGTRRTSSTGSDVPEAIRAQERARSDAEEVVERADVPLGESAHDLEDSDVRGVRHDGRERRGQAPDGSRVAELPLIEQNRCHLRGATRRRPRCNSRSARAGWCEADTAPCASKQQSATGGSSLPGLVRSGSVSV